MEAGEGKGRSGPVLTFFQPRVSHVLVLYSLFEGKDVALRRFLPKSHLSKVIIHDNTSVQRVRDIKVQNIEDSKKKMGVFFDQMKKKFVRDQQKKMTRWKKEYSRYERMLQQIDQRSLIKIGTPSFAALEAQKSAHLGHKRMDLRQGRTKLLG